MSTSYPLNVPVPHHFSYVVRNIPEVTVEQRERALKATHYNEFAFPAAMLTVDMLSDSGTTAMTDKQWAAMMLGDESYGRNTGYYVLLDAMRDCFERGDHPKKILDLVRTDCRDVEKMMEVSSPRGFWMRRALRRGESAGSRIWSKTVGETKA